MVNRILLFYLVLLFIVLPVLHAQTDGFFIERRFFQRLAWSGDGYALRYEVIIEQEENGNFRNLHQIFTTEFQIDVSLSPGLYRYRVIPYDFLGNPGTGTEWIRFEVLPAVYPELLSFEPELDLSNIDESELPDEYVLIIRGNNISPNAEFFLRVFGGTIISPSDIQISQDRRSARLVIGNPLSIPELFEIIARNPGGFEASIIARIQLPFPHLMSHNDQWRQFPRYSPEDSERGLHGDFPPSIDIENFDEDSYEDLSEDILQKRERRHRTAKIHLGAAYSPLFATFETLFLSGTTTTLSAAGLKFGFINIAEKKSFGWGLEAGVSLYSLAEVQATAIDANVLLQKQLQNNIALRYRFGAGFTSVNNSANTASTLSRSPYINTGASFLWFAGKHFYIETGADLIYWVFHDNTAGSLRPFVGFGLQF
jgi:hypothetical protein